MAEVVLKNNYSDFDGSVYQYVSGTSIGTRNATSYACLFLDKFETNLKEI